MTAENVGRRMEAPVTIAASMRPRPMTAENNASRAPCRQFHVPGASMRPRPMTAENDAGLRQSAVDARVLQ